MCIPLYKALIAPSPPCFDANVASINFGGEPDADAPIVSPTVTGADAPLSSCDGPPTSLLPELPAAATNNVIRIDIYVGEKHEVEAFELLIRNRAALRVGIRRSGVLSVWVYVLCNVCRNSCA